MNFVIGRECHPIESVCHLYEILIRGSELELELICEGLDLIGEVLDLCVGVFGDALEFCFKDVELIHYIIILCFH